MRLLVTPERSLGTKRIEDCFSPHFFETNFWAMWRTTFAFQNWHSAIELKRYMLRFLQEFPRIHTLAGVRRTALNQYDLVVRPTEKWLADQGVVFDYGTKVTDIDFLEGDDGRRVETLHGTREGKDVSYAVGPHDYASHHDRIDERRLPQWRRRQCCVAGPRQARRCVRRWRSSTLSWWPPGLSEVIRFWPTRVRGRDRSFASKVSLSRMNGKSPQQPFSTSSYGHVHARQISFSSE